MTASNYPDRKYRGLILAAMIILLCTACSAKLVRGEAPLVRMNELSHQDGNIALQLSIRNVNGVPLDISAIDFSLSVNDDEILVYTGSTDTNIVANGTENLLVSVPESETARELLDSLDNGDVKSLPYALQGKITPLEGGTLKFEHEGYIYPLPGRPGYFR